MLIIVIIQMIYQVSRDGDTSSSCEQCKRDHQHQSQSPSRQQDSSEEDPVPHSHPLTPQPSKQQHLIKILQQQNKRLKLINQDQQRELKDLRHQLQMSKIRPFLSTDYTKSTKQLQRGKLQGQITPKIGRMMSPDLKSKHQPPETLLQVALLQKQIKQLQLKLMQMGNKLRDYEQCCGWMQKFIVSFVSMSEQLSLSYGKMGQTRGLPLRKKTKICWRYMKELINYLIKQ